jgi:hypothetical protein
LPEAKFFAFSCQAPLLRFSRVEIKFPGATPAAADPTRRRLVRAAARALTGQPAIDDTVRVAVHAALDTARSADVRQRLLDAADRIGSDGNGKDCGPGFVEAVGVRRQRALLICARLSTGSVDPTGSDVYGVARIGGIGFC